MEFAILAFFLGVAVSLIMPVITARKKHGKEFKLRIYWCENKDRILIGITASLIAVGLVIITTDPVEMTGILFREVIFFAAASPISVIQSTMNKKQRQLES